VATGSTAASSKRLRRASATRGSGASSTARSRSSRGVFTGIIQATAHLERREPSGAGARLTIATPRPLARLALGESVAVNGACLTVVRRAGARFMADVSPETLARTTLGRLPLTLAVTTLADLKPGDRVNLEADVLLKQIRGMLRARRPVVG